MWCIVELLYVECIIFEFDNCTFVIVDITIVRSRKDGYYNWKLLRPVPLVHFVAVELGLVSP